MPNHGRYFSSHPDVQLVHKEDGTASEVYAYCKEKYGAKGGRLVSDFHPTALYVSYDAKLRSPDWTFDTTINFCDDVVSKRVAEVTKFLDSNSIGNANFAPLCSKYVPVGG